MEQDRFWKKSVLRPIVGSILKIKFRSKNWVFSFLVGLKPGVNVLSIYINNCGDCIIRIFVELKLKSTDKMYIKQNLHYLKSSGPLTSVLLEREPSRCLVRVGVSGWTLPPPRWQLSAMVQTKFFNIGIDKNDRENTKSLFLFFDNKSIFMFVLRPARLCMCNEGAWMGRMNAIFSLWK